MFYTFLLIIRRFLVKRFFKQQFVETFEMRRFTTPTGIVINDHSKYNQRI